MFISLDLETSGVDKDKDKIIEFGAVKFDFNGHREEMSCLIQPGLTLPQIITHITGITDEDLKDAPSFEEKRQEIADFIGDLPIIGHNIQFDTGFLRTHGIPLKHAEYDTCQLATMLIPGLPSYSLEIISHTLDLVHEDKHRALDDAVAAMELFLKLADQFRSLEPEIIEKIHQLCAKTDWATKELFLQLQHQAGTPIIQKQEPTTVNPLTAEQKVMLVPDTA